MSCCARECGDLQHIYSKLLESQSKVVGSHGFSSVFWGIPMPFPHNDCSIVHAYPQCPGVPFPLHPLQPPQPSADNRHSSNWKVILLMWTWISISLMTSGSKHFVIHHWDSHVYFWEVPTFARFSTEVFSPSWTWAFLGTPNINSTSDVCFADVSSPHAGSLSTLLRNWMNEFGWSAACKWSTTPHVYSYALILKKKIQTKATYLPHCFLLVVHSSVFHWRPQSASPVLHRLSWVYEAHAVFRRGEREKVT